MREGTDLGQDYFTDIWVAWKRVDGRNARDGSECKRGMGMEKVDGFKKI